MTGRVNFGRTCVRRLPRSGYGRHDLPGACTHAPAPGNRTRHSDPDPSDRRGAEQAAAYLRVKRKRLTDSSHRDYERGLDKLARYFPDLEIEDFEPPIGTQRLEEFLEHQYGDGSPRNYNKNLSILKDFFKFQIVRGRLHGDPTLVIERAGARQVYRTTFSNDQRRAIIAQAEDLRDRIALGLLLDYGLRNGALQNIQFKHFDHQRRRLTCSPRGRRSGSSPSPARLLA